MIRCRELCAGYPGDNNNRVPALNNVSLDIGESEFITIIGANGSGKSTLALCLSGLIPFESGKIEIDGFDINSLKEDNGIRKLPGIVFQNPDDQIITNFVDREIALVLENRGVPRDEMLQKVNDTLKQYNLDDYRDMSPNQLSGGQKQKLALASVMVSDPKYLILDETTSYLDPGERKSIISRLKKEFKSRKNEGFTVILITQFPREAALSGRIIVLDKGSVVRDGSPEEVFTSDTQFLESIGVGIPPEYKVKAAFPGLDLM